jgi:hypothetical protein
VTGPPRNPPPPWGNSRGRVARVVRLVCPCGRNIADVRPAFGSLPVAAGPWPDEPAIIVVVTRRGVRRSEHGRGDGITYRWDCRCRKTWQARDDRLDAIWREYAEPGRAVRLTLGRDVL